MKPEEPYLDSEILAHLRKFIDLHPQIQQLVGAVAQYKVVLDANIAIADIAYKYKHPHIRQTATEEAIKSSALVLYAPAWLDEEMTKSAIPQMAALRAVPEQDLQQLWTEYKKQLVWVETPPILEVSETVTGDPKDIPYVALQRSISAHAILSHDNDITTLGGNRVDLDFVLSLRSYARAASYSVGIRVGGVVVAVVSLELLTNLVKTIGSAISEIPPAIKATLFAGVVLVAAHPHSRGRVIEFLRGLGRTLSSSWPTIETLINTASRKQDELQAALGDTDRLLNIPGPIPDPPQVALKMRRRRVAIAASDHAHKF